MTPDGYRTRLKELNLVFWRPGAPGSLNDIYCTRDTQEPVPVPKPDTLTADGGALAIQRLQKRLRGF